MDLKELKEEMRKKWGFLYKIGTDDDELFYVIGCGIFNQCSYSDGICLYRRKLDQAIIDKEKELVDKYFDKLIRIAQQYKVEGTAYIDQCNKYNEFIDNLNQNQIKDLSEQLQLYIDLYRGFDEPYKEKYKNKNRY